jgi:hypothetical protein
MGKPGDLNWKDYVGPAERWDTQAAHQFTLLVKHGLRGRHRLCDVGCGSLRAGRLFIPYLDLQCYYGIEPEGWLLEEGIKHHVGYSQVAIREPRFITSRRDFPLQEFRVKFDYVLAQSIFTHATQDQVKLCLCNAAECLAPGGQILATWQKGPKDSERGEWRYPGCVSYTTDFMHAAGKAAGLKLVTEHHGALGLRGLWGTWRRS